MRGRWLATWPGTRHKQSSILWHPTCYMNWQPKETTGISVLHGPILAVTRITGAIGSAPAVVA